MWLKVFPTAIGLLRSYQYLNRMVHSESGDYKVTVNTALDIDQCPLPQPEDLMTCLPSFCYFTKLDLHIICQPEDATEGSLAPLCDYEHPLRSVLFHKITVWHCIGTSYLSWMPSSMAYHGCYLDDILVTAMTSISRTWRRYWSSYGHSSMVSI